MIRPIPAPPRRDQRGAAVISALIIVAIVAALTSLFQRQTASVRRLENEQSRLQARMLLAGGIDWARLVVRDHGKREAVTRKDQIWATPSWTRASSVPATSAWPCSPAGWRTNRASTTCTTWRAPGAAAGRGTGAAAAAGPAAPAGHAGAAHHRHRGHGPAAGAARRSPSRGRSRPPARAPRGVQELGAALGLDPAVRDELQRTMTLLPANTQVNVNTAPPKSSPRWHPACRSARPAPSPASATGAMPSTIAATSPTAWRAPASRARRPPSSPPAAGSWRAAWWSTNAPVSPRRRCCAPRPAPRPRPSG